MKILNKYLFISLLLCCSFTFNGQSNQFLKTFSSTPTYSVYQMPYPSIDTLSQNSFITSGFTMRFSNSANDTLTANSFLQKTEISGLTKWYKNYHLNGYTLTFKDLKVLKNKDILVGGLTNDYYTPDPLVKHGTLLRTDSNGYVKWFRLYPRQKIYKLLLMKDGDIAVLSSDSGASYPKNLKLALLDHNGVLKWCSKFYLGTQTELNGLDLVEGKDKRILILGYKIYTATGFLILCDSIGNKINDLSLSTPNNNFILLYNAVNYYDEGFYVVGFGQGNASNITGCILKVDNSLNVSWCKLLQTQTGDSEFMDISVIGRNNLIVFNEPENYGSGPQRSGFTFIDSNGVSRKNFLFTSDSLAIIPDEFILLKNGNVLFTAFGLQRQYFGITDTVSNGFCKYTSINYPNISGNQTFTFNSFSVTSSFFNYSTTNLYVYAPFDLEIDYLCSNGPVGPLDSIIVEDTTIVMTGINRREKEERLILYPNPANDFLILICKQNENKFCFYNTKISLINSTGEIVFTNVIASFETNIQMDIKNLKPGLYCINIEFPNRETVSEKMVISH